MSWNCSSSASAPDGIKRYFADQARETKKVVELEPFAYRISLLDSLSDREQELFLLYTIGEMAGDSGAHRRIGPGMADGETRKRLEEMFSGALSAFPEATGCVRQAPCPVESRHDGQI